MIFDFFRRKKKKDSLVEVSSAEACPNEMDKGLTVLLEALPDTYQIDKTRLAEIHDSDIDSRIDALIPTAVNSASGAVNIISHIGNYRVKLEKGGELVKSKKTKGANRAFTMNSKGIRENAELIKDKGMNAANVTTITSTAFNVASMIVGQYYMSKIDSKLSKLSSDIGEIMEDIEIQYKGQVSSLIESVFAISKYQLSSLSEEELRNRELDNIQSLKKDCQTLLSEAESKVESILAFKISKYEDYEKAVSNLQKWRTYQEILFQLLFQIDELDFTLYLGTKSKEHCYASFRHHADKRDSLHEKAVSWNKANCEKFKIDLLFGRRKHTGVLSALEKPIGLINEKWNYRTVSDEMIQTIKKENEPVTPIAIDDDNPFSKDVDIIIKDGKKYYVS